jgi:hypothetical protein
MRFNKSVRLLYQQKHEEDVAIGALGVECENTWKALQDTALRLLLTTQHIYRSENAEDREWYHADLAADAKAFLELLPRHKELRTILDE